MIVHCMQCNTRYRFDEALVTGDGVWLRCSRCQHVFFHENPVPEATAEAPVEPAQQPDSSLYGEEERHPEEEETAPQEALSGTIGGKDVEPIIAHVQEIRKAMEEERNFGLAYKEFKNNEDEPSESDVHDAEEAAKTAVSVEKKVRNIRRRSSVRKVLAYCLFFLIFVFVLGGLYLWAVPEDRDAALDVLTVYFPSVETISKDLRATDRSSAQVSLQDVRQHFVNNWLMGSLRVVEGTAINTAKYSLTRIQVRGKLYDGGGNVVGERVSFCGNLLTDAELAALTEDEIQNKLSQPPGSNAANDQVKPSGQIPFTIVFVRDPPSVVKVTVMAAGAEKLLD